MSLGREHPSGLLLGHAQRRDEILHADPLGHGPAHADEAGETALLDLGPLARVDRLDAQLEQSAHGAVVACRDLVAAVVELLDAAGPPVQEAVAPRRRALLLGRVVRVRADVVLVRRREGDGEFGKGGEAEARDAAARDHDLVAFQELGEFVAFDPVDDRVARDRVDAVVQVAVQDADFVVEDLRAVAAADVQRAPGVWVKLGIQSFGFQDAGYIVVPVRGLPLGRRPSGS